MPFAMQPAKTLCPAGHPMGWARAGLVAMLAMSVLAPAHAARRQAAPVAAVEPAPLGPVMAGEFALQAGRLPEAARWYLEAAEAGRDDAVLAERATRISLLAGDDASAGKALALWRQRAPGELGVLASGATLALRQGRLDEASGELKQLLASPDPRAWKFALVSLAGGGRDPAAAATVLGTLVDAGAIPDKLEAWQEFGRLALRMEQPALSKRIVGELVTRFPDEPRVALLRASQLRQEGEGAQALALLRGIEPKAAADIDLRNALSVAYDALGEPAAAERVLGQGPQDLQSFGMRAALLAKQDDTAALAELYRELSAQSPTPDPSHRLLLGKIAEFLKRYQEAVRWYDSVPEGELQAEAKLRMVSALHELGEHARALEQVRALQADATLDDDARRDGFLLEAELHLRQGDDRGEMDALARGLAAWPDDGALLYSRALAWERRDDIPRAEADLRKVLVTEPENVAALNALGYTLADRTHRYQEALELIDRARVAEPDNAAIVDSYGWVLYRLGRNEEALVQLRRAWSLSDADAEIAVHIGQVLWTLGRKDEARKYFDQARELDPENRALQRVTEQLGL